MGSHKRIDKYQIGGFLASTLVAIAVGFLTQDTLGSISLGALLAILTQLFDLQLRQAQIEENLSQVVELAKDIYSDDTLYSCVHPIVSDYHAISSGAFPVFSSYALKAISECQASVRDLAQGVLRERDRDKPSWWESEGLSHCRESVKATSLFLKWWSSNNGEKYLQAHQPAILRNVTFTRVFINKPDQFLKYKHVIQRQQGMGINVFLVNRDDLDRSYQRELLVMDDRLFTGQEYDQTGSVVGFITSTKASDVKIALDVFDLVMRQSMSAKDYFGEG